MGSRRAARLKIVLLLACAAPARGDLLFGSRPPRLAAGGLETHPYLRLSEAYNSNLLLRPAGGEADTWVHTVNPGFKASLTRSSHRLDAGYDAAFQAFTRDPSIDNTLNQAGDLLYTYSGPRITTRVRDLYVNTVDPPNSEQTDRLRRWQNVAGVDAEYAPAGGALFFGAQAAHRRFKYVAEDPVRPRLNRYEQTAGLKVGYRVMPRSRAYAAYRRGIVHYTEAEAGLPSRNSKSHVVAVGLDRDVGPKLTGGLEAGLDYRGYDEAASAGAGRLARNLTLAATLAYEPLERTRVELAASRALQEATFANNRYYVATGGTVGVEHALPIKVALALFGGFERDVFSEHTFVAGVARRRRDDLYQGRAGLEYDLLERLRLGVSYQHRARFSKDLSGQFSYRVHIAAVTAAFSL